MRLRASLWIAMVASAMTLLAAAPAHAGIWVIYHGWGDVNLCAGQFVRGPSQGNGYMDMSRNHVQTNGGGWDIGFTRHTGSYQNAGTIVTTNYTLHNNHPATDAYAWHQNKNRVCVNTQGRYLTYP